MPAQQRERPVGDGCGHALQRGRPRGGGRSFLAAAHRGRPRPRARQCFLSSLFRHAAAMHSCQCFRDAETSGSAAMPYADRPVPLLGPVGL